MTRFISTLVALAVMAPGPVVAQQSDVQLPDYTAEQRWQRLANGMVAFQAALLELGKQTVPQGLQP